jgi:hypothetical protein
VSAFPSEISFTVAGDDPLPGNTHRPDSEMAKYRAGKPYDVGKLYQEMDDDHVEGRLT